MNDAVVRMEWAEFDTPEGFWKKMAEVANLPECENDRRHEATRWADAELTRLREENEGLRKLVEEVIEAFAFAPLGEWDTVGSWMNRAKIIGEDVFNEAFDRGRRAGGG